MSTKKDPQKGKTLKFTTHSIGEMTIHLLTNPVNPEDPPERHVRLSNQEIAQAVTENYPERKANGAVECVAWYASKIRKDKEYRLKKAGGRNVLPARDKGAPKAIEVTVE